MTKNISSLSQSVSQFHRLLVRFFLLLAGLGHHESLNIAIEVNR